MTTPSNPLYREIPLTKGQVAIVDADNYEWLRRYAWSAWWNKGTRSFYARRSGERVNGRNRTVYMHREILGLRHGDIRQGDHVNPGETLRNTNDNLRIATHQENQYNRRRNRESISGYKGVYVDHKKKRNKYIAQITINGENVKLGCRSTAEKAHDELYAPKALRVHGKFTCLG